MVESVKKRLSKNDMKSILIKRLKELYPNCWICGKKPETDHHIPPRCMKPKMQIKIPTCYKCHWMLNSGNDYTAKEKRSLRSSIRKIEKSCRNVRGKFLEK